MQLKFTIRPWYYTYKNHAFFFFFAAALKIQQQNAYRGNTGTSDNLPQRLQALWWSSALNEVPSWQMNGLLVEWHEDINQRHKKHWQQWPVIMFTNTWPGPFWSHIISFYLCFTHPKYHPCNISKTFPKLYRKCYFSLTFQDLENAISILISKTFPGFSWPYEPWEVLRSVSLSVSEIVKFRFYWK